MRVERREEPLIPAEGRGLAASCAATQRRRPRQLVGCVKPTAFATGPQGVYYVACDSSPDPALHVIDPKTGRDRVLGRLEQYQNDPGVLPLGLAVSPDGMSILYLRHMRDTSDLMLIENFR